MTRHEWRRLSEREAGVPKERALHAGVPEHLDQPLRNWLGEAFGLDSHLAQRVTLTLGMSSVLEEFDGPVLYTPAQVILERSDQGQLLDAVDAVLSMGVTERPDIVSRPPSPTQRFDRHVEGLIQFLDDANSVYGLSDNRRSLKRRVTVTAEKSASQAAVSARQTGRLEAARDLEDAWEAVYGLHANPSEAYRLAIRAVEDVAIPVLLPASPSATLGAVRAHLRDAPAKWQLAIQEADTDPLLSMINLLWTGQTDRHAGQATLDRVDLAAAEMSVHLAATLVQWFASGHVSPTSETAP